MGEGMTHTIEKNEQTGGFDLRVPLPFADKNDMDLYRSRDEITLRVGPYRRNIVLPYALWELELVEAKFDKSTLVLRFENKGSTKTTSTISSATSSTVG
jgi:arsenite/tail-anchored protein-transporting ATPase